MKQQQSLGKALFFCFVFLSLSACSPAKQHRDVYRGSAGAHIVLGDVDACRASCERSYDRCLDSGAAQYNRAHDSTVSSVLGGEGDCKADLQSCLSACK